MRYQGTPSVSTPEQPAKEANEGFGKAPKQCSHVEMNLKSRLTEAVGLGGL
jgi:hypothetical protein